MYRLVSKRGYYEIQDDGLFVLSADTPREAWDELEKLDREGDLD